MSLELSESGMGLDLCAKFGEFSPMGSMTSLEEEEEFHTIGSRQLSCPDPNNNLSPILPV